MDQEKEQVTHWLKVFANFRNGSALSDIIKMEESFIKDPYWLSPLYQDGYRRYHTFELDGVIKAEDFPFAGDGPLWDGICKDNASRKLLFVMAQDNPEVLKGDCGDISAEEEAAVAKVYEMLHLDSNLDIWYHEFYPVAKAIAFVTLLGSPFGHCLEQGFRSELIFMNIVNNFLGVKTTQAEWNHFYDELIGKMFGQRGMPYVSFTVNFEV
jgi:hypothetical protein